MADDIEASQIARIEARIEALRAVLESCRKIMLVARIAMAAGAAWIAATLAGLVPLQPLALIAAISAIIGGIVAYGSNASTARQSQAEIHAAEAERSELIAGLDLKPVAGVRFLH